MGWIIRVTSKNNRVYTDILRLHQKKYRDREGRYLVEGENLVREAIRQHADILDLVIREGSGYLSEALEEFPAGSVYVFDGKLFDAAAPTESSQGILAVIRKPDQAGAGLPALDRPGGNLVVLDRLQDPGNIGTIIRTAEGAGYEAVLVIRGTADVFSPKVVRAAAGAIFRMPILMADTWKEMAELVRSCGKKLAVTSIRDHLQYYEADLSRDIALVIGNEGNGCDPELIEAADLRVSIPMGGQLESLNASVAAGILMYEAVRK